MIAPGRSLSGSTIRLKFRDEVNYVLTHRGKGKFKLFSSGSGFTGQIFTGKLSEVDSVRTTRQGVLSIYLRNKKKASWSLLTFVTNMLLNIDK